MTSRFVIGVEALTKDQETKFSEYLSASGCAWWHRVPNFWLVSDQSEKMTCEILSQKLHEYNNHSELIVTRVTTHDSYFFFSMTDKDRKVSQWINEYWHDLPKSLPPPSTKL